MRGAHVCHERFGPHPRRRHEDELRDAAFMHAESPSHGACPKTSAVQTFYPCCSRLDVARRCQGKLHCWRRRPRVRAVKLASVARRRQRFPLGSRLRALRYLAACFRFCHRSMHRSIAAHTDPMLHAARRHEARLHRAVPLASRRCGFLARETVTIRTSHHVCTPRFRPATSAASAKYALSRSAVPCCRGG